jgi:hypothetical protein
MFASGALKHQPSIDNSGLAKIRSPRGLDERFLSENGSGTTSIVSATIRPLNHKTFQKGNLCPFIPSA